MMFDRTCWNNQIGYAKQLRDKIMDDLKICKSTLDKSIRKLKERDYIIVNDGTIIFNPNRRWKGDTNQFNVVCEL